MAFDVSHHLIQSVKNGDKRAFGVLIDSCSSYVYAVALKLTGDADDARDASQESFLKIWEKIYMYKSHYKFSTWIYKLVVNTCLDKLRGQKRRNELFETMENLRWTRVDFVNSPFEEKQFIGFIRSISAMLPAKQHTVFVLHDLEEMSQDEIASILGMSKGGVKSNLYYARKAVRNMMVSADQQKISNNHEM